MDANILFQSVSNLKSHRDGKGKSLISFPDDYCIVDIETTGLSPEYDEIIELSAMKISSGNIIDTFSSLVKPSTTFEDGTYIDSYIEKLTGITNDMLSNAPSEDVVIRNFSAFLCNSIIVAHNANFDINFIYESYVRVLGLPLSNDFIDTMRISRRLHRDWDHHRLKDLSRIYHIDYSNAHRALEDCNITFHCYQAQREEILASFTTFDDFIKSLRPHHCHSRGVRASDIHATTDQIDSSNPFYGKTIVFTGALERMLRKDAMQIVVNLGGICGDSVTKSTNYLILGDLSYSSNIKDGKSSKQKKAEKLKLSGQDIDIMPETVFYDMISDYFNDDFNTRSDSYLLNTDDNSAN